MLLDNGLFTNCAVVPAVPPGQDLIRTSYMATHTNKQLDFALDVFEKVGKEMGVIPGRSVKGKAVVAKGKRRKRLKARFRKGKAGLSKWMKSLYKR